jgi:hypothetical protein
MNIGKLAGATFLVAVVAIGFLSTSNRAIGGEGAKDSKGDPPDSTFSLIAEANAASPVELAVTYDRNNFEPNGYMALQGKNFSNKEGGPFETCDSAGTRRCPTAPLGFTELQTIDFADGYSAVQIKIVPNGGASVRGRLIVQIHRKRK